jgi:hypothetical protein
MKGIRLHLDSPELGKNNTKNSLMQLGEDGGRLEEGEKLTLGLLGFGRVLPHGRRQRRGRTERLW